MNPANAGTPWSAEQDTQLIALAREGKTVAEVAQLMGRTPEGIVARADRLSYRLTSIDQFTLLSGFIRTAESPAATRLKGASVRSVERATCGAPGLQAHHSARLPLLLEVHTESFHLALHALQVAGFDVKCRPDFPVRYVVNDPEKQGESVSLEGSSL